MNERLAGLKGNDAWLAELLSISRDISTLSLDQLIRRSLDFVERQTSSTIGFYHFVEDDQNSISLQGWSTNTIANMCQAQGDSRHYPVDQAGIWADCIRTRAPVIINDYANAPGKHGMPKGHARIDRLVSIPLMRDGLIRAIIGLGNKPADYTDQDVETIYGMMSVLFHLIEHKRFGELARRAQKSEGLGRMAGAIAHNFNNLMAAVIGNLEMALRDMTSGTREAGLVVAAMQSAHKAAALSGNMLAYLGQSAGVHEPVELVELARKIIDNQREWAPGNISLELQVPIPGPVVMADEIHLRQAVMSLLRNAVEAIGSAPGSIRVTMETLRPQDIPFINRFPFDFRAAASEYAVLSVSDDGCGVDSTEVEKIFDPFYSTKFSGRGLGLPTALGIIRRYEGCICVSSEQGRGSHFRLFLPLAAGAERSESPVKATPQLAESVPARACRVLLVDDDPGVRSMAAGMLKYLGVSVVEAEDGVSALEILEQDADEITCLLSDLTMPRMDGWETLERARAMKPRLPAVITSGYDRAHMLEGARSQMPEAFLAKPFDLASLKKALLKAMPGGWTPAG